MKFSIQTLGCKVNQSEGNLIESALLSSGHEKVPLSDSPDICIVNTCTVTAKSDYQSRQYIRRALKRGAQVYVTGCYSQLNAQSVSKLSSSILIIDNKDKLSIINMLNSNNEVKALSSAVSRSRAFVKIQDGCNYRCSYCAIPLARGNSGSIQKEEIIEEINKVNESGINEVVLTGIHIGLYGLDLKPRLSLKRLLKDILLFTTIPRIRLSSLEVKEIDDETLDIISDLRICKHLHIPLQSGDSRILELMERNYAADEFNTKIERILRTFPDICIGSDVIVGFPQEDDRSFRKSYDFIDHSDLSYLHIFPYSRRNNTKALSLPGHVCSTLKHQRVTKMTQLAKKKKQLYMEKFVGKEVDVIVESEINEHTYTSTSGNYLKVNVKGRSLKRGSLIFTKIVNVENDRLSGTALN